MQPEQNYGYRPGPLEKRTALHFGISFAAHLLLVFFLLFMPDSKESHSGLYRFESIDVQLVSLNPGLPRLSAGGEGLGGGDAFVEGAAEDALEAPLADGAVEEASPVPLLRSAAARPSGAAGQPLTLPEDLRASAPAVKQSASQRPARAARQELVTPEDLERRDGGRRVAESVRRLEQEATADGGRAAVQRRIDQLAGQTAGQSRPQGSGRGIGSGSAGAGGRGGGASPEHYSRIQIYQAEVYYKLRSNWVFSEALAGNIRGLESRLVMRIMPDGEIRDVWFEKRSGNAYLDDSAYKTVMKSNPLPPLPDGMTQYNLVVGFTPGGLQ